MKAEHKAEMTAAHDRFSRKFDECKMHYKTQMREEKAQLTKQVDLLESFKNVLTKNLGNGYQIRCLS